MNVKSRLADEVCVVTGAGNGIGAATAEVFAEAGAAAVVCVDLDGAAAARTAQRICERGALATSMAVDISNADQVTALVEFVTSTHGRIDVLHNNAGLGVFGSVHEVTLADWDLCQNVNVRGTFLVTRAVLPVMLAQAKGSIVNTCSTFATVASPQVAAYHASKGAIKALTRQMARDYSPDIRVNCVSPGLVDTPLARSVADHAADPEQAWRTLEESNRYYRRAAEPREIAYGVLFLASAEASFVTGHDLVMSGGQGEVAL